MAILSKRNISRLHRQAHRPHLPMDMELKDAIALTIIPLSLNIAIPRSLKVLHPKALLTVNNSRASIVLHLLPST